MTKRKTLEVGDKVRVYGNSQTGYGTHGELVKIVDHVSEGWVAVRVENRSSTMFNQLFTVHVNQCRRIKPARKMREWWVNEAKILVDQTWSLSLMVSTISLDNVGTDCIRTTKPQDTTGWIRIREMREKK